jgi:hypothetical protein
MSSIALLTASAIETSFYRLYPRSLLKIMPSLFNIANAAGVLFFARKLNSKLPEGVIALSFIIGALAVDRFLPVAPVKTDSDGNLVAPPPLSFQQKITKTLHTTKLVEALGLTFLNKNPITSVATAACSLYNLIENSKIHNTLSDYRWESQEKSPPSINIWVFYSLFKCAVFTALRNHPARTVSLFYAECVFGLFDIFHFIDIAINIKASNDKAKTFPKRKIALLGIIAVRASYFGASSLHNYFKHIDVTPALNSISVSWAYAPLMHRLIQTLYVCKIIGNLALAWFSKEKLMLVLASVAESFSLNSISEFKWINFTQTIYTATG